jgi:hypothetical protein
MPVKNNKIAIRTVSKFAPKKGHLALDSPLPGVSPISFTQKKYDGHRRANTGHLAHPQPHQPG